MHLFSLKEHMFIRFLGLNFISVHYCKTHEIGLISVQIIRPHIFVILLPYWSSFQMSLSAGNYCLVEAREH